MEKSAENFTGKVKLYTMNTQHLTDAAYFHKCCSQLSKARQAKIDGYYFRKDKMLSLAAGILLDRGLLEHGLREAEVRIGLRKNGKPYLPDYPQIYFNLAHSETMAMAAFADAEVGCDIEYTAKADMELAKYCFRPEEYAFLAGLEGEEQDSAFFQLWTLKESFLKATGAGMELPLHEFGFCVSDGGIRVRQSFDRYEYLARQYHFGQYWAAVCVRS